MQQYFLSFTWGIAIYINNHCSNGPDHYIYKLLLTTIVRRHPIQRRKQEVFAPNVVALRLKTNSRILTHLSTVYSLDSHMQFSWFVWGERTICEMRENFRTLSSFSLGKNEKFLLSRQSRKLVFRQPRGPIYWASSAYIIHVCHFLHSYLLSAVFRKELGRICHNWLLVELISFPFGSFDSPIGKLKREHLDSEAKNIKKQFEKSKENKSGIEKLLFYEGA